MKKVLTEIARTLRRWRPMYKAVMEEELMVVVQKIELEAKRPHGIGWSPLLSQVTVSQLSVMDCIAVGQQSFDSVMAVSLV